MKDIDLIEIQELNSRKIIAQKLHEAHKSVPGNILVDDVSMELAALGNFPGPLIRWFREALDCKTIYLVAKRLGNTRIDTICTIGLLYHGKEYFFEARVPMTLVSPRGSNGFGLDPILQPTGCKKTMGQMDTEEKNRFSHRGKALEKVRRFLEQKERASRT